MVFSHPQRRPKDSRVKTVSYFPNWTAGALDRPVLDLIDELLCLRVKLVIYVAQLGQFVHHLQGILPVFDAQDALEAHDAVDP